MSRIPGIATGSKQLTISAQKVLDFITALLLSNDTLSGGGSPSKDGGSSSGGKYSSSSASRKNNGPQTIFNRRNHSPPPPSRNKDDNINNDAGHHLGSDQLTSVMERLHHIAESRKGISRGGSNNNSSNTATKVDPVVEPSRIKFRNAVQSIALTSNSSLSPIKLNWTMSEFCDYADEALDKIALDTIFFRLFATGILPSRVLELDLVQTRWLEWSRSAALQLGILGKDVTTENSAAFMSMITQAVISLLDQCQGIGDTGIVSHPSTKSDESNHKNGANTNPVSKNNNRLNIRKVWGGIGGFDYGGVFGHGVLYCVDKRWWESWESYTGWDILIKKASSIPASEIMLKSKLTTKQPILHTNSVSSSARRSAPVRPGELSTECLLDRDADSLIAGTYGSSELMKLGLNRDADYVLVPPGVWDILYELYGGGPPLPRPVLPPHRKLDDSSAIDTSFRPSNVVNISDDKKQQPFDENGTDGGDENCKGDGDGTIKATTPALAEVLRIPKSIQVALYPWIFHVHLCDPQQPYRRGDAGPISIRVMATPDEPLWRVYAEVIVRLPMQNLKIYGSDGRGRGRFWKKVYPTSSTTAGPGAMTGPGYIGPKDPINRYGPWTLLCKNRSALLPHWNTNYQYLQQKEQKTKDNSTISSYEFFQQSWRNYADNSTVEGIGLQNGDYLMLECAIINSKTNDILWPREAAAKAGRLRRLAEEDIKLKHLLRNNIKGRDNENVSSGQQHPNTLIGMTVDAMDSSGRWYNVHILKLNILVKVVEANTDDSNNVGNNFNSEMTRNRVRENEIKQVKVDFSDFGGHFEWIDIESDRLATSGRFTLRRAEDNTSSSQQNSPHHRPQQHQGMGSVGNGGRPNNTMNGLNTSSTANKSLAVTNKKGLSDNGPDNGSGGKVCNFPGYGACGLGNLGNTCYQNSAIQCMSYMPLLRAYLLRGQYRSNGDLNRDNPLGTGGKLLEEFAELLRLMWSARHGDKSPTRFRAQLGKARPQFSGADQQDAQEVLNYMLDVLHEDSNKVRKKPYVEALEDDWVTRTNLFRVGEEAWRRFLRRNRSIMTDVAMGQVLNTVTCPVCQFSSRNFDPFNLLSIPIPTVSDVIFQCTVMRRATTFNCPWILNKSRKNDSKRRARFNFNSGTSGAVPPAEQFVAEQYIIAMSRLADSGDLRLQIQNVCGIPANNLRLCRAEEATTSLSQDGTTISQTVAQSVVARQLKVTPLSDKEGPCSQLARQQQQRTAADGDVAPTQIIAFESTLSPRPAFATFEEEKDSSVHSEGTSDDEEDDIAGSKNRKQSGVRNGSERRELEKVLKVYGDEKECRIFDTDAYLIAKAVSRSLWPRNENELKLGLRVDAIDHRGNWFPGSVIEFVEGVKSMNNESNHQPEHGAKIKVRVHFDNFSSKWDEFYAIDHFRDGKVRPLYSHSSRRVKPTEFIVHHRHTDSVSRLSNMFGQSFYVQCHNEWSTARAGAHILAQATRFLQRSSDWSGPIDLDDPSAIERDAKVQRLYERTHASISDLIDLLLDCDREYIRLALSVSEHNTEAERNEPFRNPTFDATVLSQALVKKVSTLVHRLPFEIRVCTIEATVGGKPVPGNEEVNFPFSLMRTIGNYMNARHAVVLQWKEPPTDKKSGAVTNYLNAPVMYVEPNVVIDRASAEILKNQEEARTKTTSTAKRGDKSSRPGSGGVHLGVCLTEFCKVQQLSINDNWRCPRCRDYREGKQNLLLWRLPDLLTFHIKRFNCSARWREKISTKVNFPLTGLDMSEWCHKESPVIEKDSKDSYVYDLIGVMNHYGSMTGGHYVAVCKATACGRDGREEVAHNFNGVGANSIIDVEEHAQETEIPSTGGWRIGRTKAEVVNQSKVAAAISAKGISESAEPLWLQFDDDLVEPVPPRYVVSEMAYVLFYRRRRLTPSNIAKYSTLE